MNIKDENRDLFVKEIKLIREKMQTEKDPLRKNFYFSGIYGFAHRMLNIDFDPALITINISFQIAHSQIQERMNALKHGDTVIPLDSTFWERLGKLLEGFEETIRKKEDDLYSIVEKLFCLTYETIGNGYFLKQKGVF